jgi:hypothetical protein
VRIGHVEVLYTVGIISLFAKFDHFLDYGFQLLADFSDAMLGKTEFN